jgi:hypothetical protein
MELSFSLKQKKTDSSLLPKSGITRVMSVLERRSRLRRSDSAKRLFLDRGCGILDGLCDGK